MNHTYINRALNRAFTLVELLVVIVIIGMLAGLLIPAINMAREAARIGACINNQRQIVTAIINYETQNKGLPGSLNSQGLITGSTSPLTFSWAVAILPDINETKRYEVILENLKSAVALPTEATIPPPVFGCPSDRSKEDKDRFNYVVNSGPDAGDTHRKSNPPDAKSGQVIDASESQSLILFKDRRSALAGMNKKVKLEDVKDGTSNTVLIAENLQAGDWRFVPNPAAVPPTGTPDQIPDDPNASTPNYYRSSGVVNNLGFVWSGDSKNTNSPNLLPNKNRKSSGLIPRPSSNHPGLVVLGLADGSARRENDDVDSNVYVKLVCPDNVKYDYIVTP
ncbi:MAG: DUF1559 domain-containing protein [Thermoguttaceae bacterium]